MIATVNRQVLLTSHPTGIPESRHFQIVESALPTPAGNQVLVRNLFAAYV
jgi:NADPH-dependent curcumin reductase CurA